MGPPAARTRRGRIRHSALSQRNRSTPYDCPVSQSSATGSTSLVPGSPISRSNTLTPHTPASISPTTNLLNSNLISSTPSLLNSSSRLTHSQPPTIASSPRPRDTSPAISSSAPFRTTSHLSHNPDAEDAQVDIFLTKMVSISTHDKPRRSSTDPAFRPHLMTLLMINFVYINDC